MSFARWGRSECPWPFSVAAPLQSIAKHSVCFGIYNLLLPANLLLLNSIHCVFLFLINCGVFVQVMYCQTINNLKYCFLFLFCSCSKLLFMNLNRAKLRNKLCLHCFYGKYYLDLFEFRVNKYSRQMLTVSFILISLLALYYYLIFN